MGPISRMKIPAGAAAPPPAPEPASPADAPDADISMVDAQTPSTIPPHPTNKRKRKEKETHILHQTTFRNPVWSYFHITLVTPGTAAQPLSSATTSPNPPAIDALTVSTLLLQPLTAYLGTTGAAIPIDILHTTGRSAYVRLPRQDARGFRAALSGWVGGCDAGSLPGVLEGGRVSVAWRVVAEGGSMGLLGGTGEEIFGAKGASY